MSDRPLPALLPPEAFANGLLLARQGGGTTRLDGERATVIVAESGPIGPIRMGGERVVDRVETAAGSVANGVYAPGAARREWVGPAGVTTETVVVMPTLPLVAVQYEAGAGTGLEPVRIHLPFGPGDGLRFDAGVGREVELSSDAARTETRDDGSVTLDPDGGSSLTLLIAFGEAGPREAAFRAGQHLAGHLRRALDPDRMGIVLRTGVEEIDDGWSWARARLAGRVAAAARDGRRVDALLATIAATWTGDEPVSGSALPLHSDPKDQAWLRERYRRVFGGAVTPLERPAEESASGPTRSLPMVGAAAAPSREEWLDRLGDGEPTADLPAGLTQVHEQVFARVAALRGQTDASWQDWRGRLGAGLAGGAGAAMWDPHVDETPVLAPQTASILLETAVGILGLSPDAAVGRIRIAPRFPSHMTAFEASGLVVGDAGMTLRFARDGSVDRYTLEPTRGGVPATAVVILTSHSRVTETRVDGAPAELDVRSTGTRTTAQLQLPVDGVRTVELITDR